MKKIEFKSNFNYFNKLLFRQNFFSIQSKSFFSFFKKFNPNLNFSEQSKKNQQNFTEENQNEKINSSSTNTETNPNTSILSITEASKYVEDKVKKYDYYSYVIGKTLPNNLRTHYFAYNCFFSELIKSRFISREQSVCKMRLGFWEETLIEILKGNKPRDPLSVLLKDALENSNIRKETLFRMIDFQYFDLERNSEIRTIQDLEVYAENTRSLLIYLNLNLLQINDKEAFYTASHIGRGVGIVDVLKQMVMLIKMHYNFIPLEIMEKHACNYISLWDRHGVVSEEFYDCILEVAAYARKHIEIGRSNKDKLPKYTNVALLNSIDSYYFLDDLQNVNFDIFDPQLRKISTYKIPKMILSNGKKGTY